ncbi:tyrosine-type recombinase/integrase [Caulobacter segnis]|uniref:tyrosine-type recombinase/integrase n=1 Tax=Caulobacter segnis TaxID=88688 RepID=UPI00240ECBD9|nr:tyrosine-type recombinase/integrase [Caulobacter segnis]MDG2522137.1 tyrosine-type recombinase/integrase [Caulobacter segnis]
MSSSAVQETWSNLFDPGTPPSTVSAYRLALRYFFSSPQVAEVGAAQHVTDAIVRAWDDAAAEAGVTTATRRQRLAAIAHFYRRLRIYEPSQVNPTWGIKPPRLEKAPATTALDRNQIKMLLEAMPTETWLDIRDRAIFATFYFTAIRASELTGLNIGTIADIGGTRCLLVQNSRRQVRRLAIGLQFSTILDAYLDVHPYLDGPDTPLFPSKSGKRLLRQETWSIITRRFKELGIDGEGISSHSFRAASLTNYLESGGDLRGAQQLAGHSSVNLTRRYDREAHASIDVSLLRL